MAATKFDVGGYKLAAEISGEGSPAVVFVSGSGDAGEPWDAAISALRSSTTLLTYARAGIGDSETPDDSTPRSVGAAAEELRRLLVAIDVPGPFVLVGHSFGALIALVFAAQRALVADLGAGHKVARFGGHYVQKDDPTIVADAIDDLIDVARRQ